MQTTLVYVSISLWHFNYTLAFLRQHHEDIGGIHDYYINFTTKGTTTGTSVSEAKYGHTKFSQLTDDQFKELFLSDLRPVSRNTVKRKPLTPEHLKQLNISQKLDWRTKLGYNVISPVKNQNKCGGCWAFSTVETVESMYAIATGKAPTPLAVQEVIDCAYPNQGCSGGDTCVALHWMTKGTPLVSEAVYPLRDESDFCTIITNKTRGIKVFVKSYTCNRGLPEDRLLELLQSGPVVAAVDAKTWQNYQGGIIQYHCESHINHAVQIVGYDLTGPVPYYIVRNSWGTDFGHSGYLYIKVGDNLCGIAEEVSTVSVYL